MAGDASETSPLLRVTSGGLATDGVDSNLGADFEHELPVEDGSSLQSPSQEEVLTQLRWYIFPAVSIGIFLAAADQTIIASSYGKIGSELEALNLTSWIATSYFLTLTSFQPLYGKLSDIFGRKQCLLFAYVIFGLGSLLCGLAQDIYQLIAARAIQGIGGGGMTTVVSILLSDMVSLQSRGQWQGYVNIIYATGAAVGAPLGGLLADTVGWRWIFLFQPPLCVVAIAAVALVLKIPLDDEQKWKEKLRRVDVFGALTLVVAVLGLIFGLDRGSNISWRAPIAYIPLIISALSSIGFGFVEAKIANEPFAPGRIILNRSLVAAYLCNFFSIGCMLAVYFYIPFFYQAVDGLSAASSSLRLLPAIVSSVSGSLFAGFYIKRTGKLYWLTVVAYCSLALGVLLVLLFTVTIVKQDVVTGVGLAISAFGNGIGVTSTLIAVISNADAEDQAIATATSYLFRQLGTTIGISTSATIIQQQLRRLLQRKLGSGKEAAEIERRVRQSLDALKTLPPKTELLVRSAYGDAVGYGFILMLCMGIGAAVSGFFIHEKSLKR